MRKSEGKYFLFFFLYLGDYYAKLGSVADKTSQTGSLAGCWRKQEGKKTSRLGNGEHKDVGIGGAGSDQILARVGWVWRWGREKKVGNVGEIGIIVENGD